jgi:hypothetical protein
MKYSVEIGSGAVTYISSLIKIDSDILKLIEGGVNLQIQRHWETRRHTGKQTVWRLHKLTFIL